MKLTILRSGKLVMPNPQPPKQTNQTAGGPPVTTLAAPCTLPRGVGSQPMQDAMTQLVVNLVTSSNNSLPSGGRKRQPAIMTTSIIREQIDMG